MCIRDRLELERLTGLIVEEVWHRELFDYLELMPETEEDTIRLAEFNSPEARISAQSFQIVEADVRARNRANTPALEAFGQLDIGEQNGIEIDDTDLGIRFNVPIFQGGQRNAIAEEGALNVQEALRLRQQEQLRLRQVASVAWATVGIAERAEQVWDRVLQVQELRLQAVQNEVDADLATQDILLDARSELVETRSDHVRARYDVVRAQLALLRAAGLASPTAGIERETADEKSSAE